MTITIVDEMKMEKIPSGSGIIKSGNIYYVVGDDSPFLYSLNSEFKTISKTPLLEPVDFSERILKSEKPDFEALELIDKNEIVVFGSGSKSPQRNIFLRILLEDSLKIEKYDISDFYNKLIQFPLFKDSELNIEATAFRDNQLFLFNRKPNLIIRFEYKDFLAYLNDGIDFPKPEIRQFSLPNINGIEAGFSGATALTDEPKIIFTASVEDTDNAYDDGEILGSLIGIIDISNNTISESFEYCLIPNAEANLKVESVTVEKEISSGKTKVVLITDDDRGNSRLLTGLLLW
ncbi:hypothetical protein [Algoriphagus sp. A40]|uniref:DUF6929 family protein n=1 Tax=Algoriphagus sp. A40 TaxID=1945863 RepID=UPI00098612BA|nr:hypothetical protein [Algoriphagus sp. A40]OOG75343.1 hypothetical protein B0E43_10195 [Algoriphagus sp. A40]